MSIYENSVAACRKHYISIKLSRKQWRGRWWRGRGAVKCKMKFWNRRTRYVQLLPSLEVTVLIDTTRFVRRLRNSAAPLRGPKSSGGLEIVNCDVRTSNTVIFALKVAGRVVFCAEGMNNRYVTVHSARCCPYVLFVIHGPAQKLHVLADGGGDKYK
jgi:hypothetical protein